MAKDEAFGAARLLTMGDQASTIADDPLATVRPSRADLAVDDRVAYEELLVELNATRGRAYYYHHFGPTLGEGAMGQVRVAVQPRLEREVAVKVLKDGHKNEASTLRLLQEAWVTGILEHPNIVPVHEIAVDPEGSPQVVLKRIRGRRWNDLMHERSALQTHLGDVDPFEWNLRTLMTVATAVQHAHRRGIVHRDIKPENVMVGAHGEIYVVDWGIAVSLRPEDGHRIQLASNVTEMSGTPAYMAPEMVQPEPPISHRTDVYLLGATLYQIIVGHSPHSGADLMELVRNVIKSDPPYPTDAPPDLVAIANRAMAPNPDDRFASADTFREAIQRFLDGRVAARLCYTASLSLTKLESAAEKSEGLSSARRAELYDLYGACRFGFQQALMEGPNEVARRGMSTAAQIVARFELDQKNVDAAERLLLELDDADPALIADLRKKKARAQNRQDALEALRRDQDPRVGQRARLSLALILGVVFTVAPLVLWKVGARGSEQLLTTAFAAAVFLGAGALLALWKREEMTASALNRGLLGTIFLTMLAQIAVDAGIFLYGGPVFIASLMRLFLWFAVTAMAAITLDHRLWPWPVGYLVGFFVACLWPDGVFVAMSGANLVFLLNAVWLWWPR